ncbi:MAG: hypothetical protein Q7S32_01225 [bacterium]|nr:hypothetical protein [bacterium]
MNFLKNIFKYFVLAGLILGGGVALAVDDGSAVKTETPTPTADASTSGARDPGTAPTAVPVATGAVSAPVTRTPTPTPKISYSPTPRPSISISPTPTPTPTPSPTPLPSPGMPAGLLTAVAVGLGAVVLGFLGFSGKLKKKKSEKEKERCGSIRELLERKKKELENYLRSLPEEKVKELAKKTIVGGLKKDEDLKKILETIEGAKEKYDKLKEAIELLGKQYNLCMLELPSGEETKYEGTIVESSLRDKEILKSLKIKKTYALEDWMLNDVMVSEKQIEKLGEYLQDGPWYMHFWQPGKDDVIVVFKDKVFKIKSSDKNTWTEAIKHGTSKDIPEEQLDFRTNK